ncbi:zinc finger protein 850-like isoform X2 [Frankliniella occidentalis]|uniref:Zinc finger protein 850-like isoform X2 n=1 Tax=Frankliniella occidentalis TaxID=133901 RepID=A0A9C6XQ90_FRAOC|nr:zinc finger protein 850-like isoform X2 [Frankliniella occidentalis]
MVLVSYIDILDYIHDDRQCLIEGENLFNGNKVKNVKISCRAIDDVFEVSALCVCSNESNLKDSFISIEINQGDQKSISSKCTCESDRLSKCQHVAAALIHLHRHPPPQPPNVPNKESPGQLSPENHLNGGIAKQPGKDTEHNFQRRLRKKCRATSIANSIKDDSRTVNTKHLHIDNESSVDDPTWDKENDEDDAFDWAQSSEDEWEPAPEKKRVKKEMKLLPDKGSKEKTKKTRNRMTKSEAEKKAKELLSTLQLTGEDGQFLCHICDKTFPKQSELQDHIRDIHLLKKEVFSCCKCDKTFRLLRTLKAHEGTCDVNSEEDGDLFPSEETQEIEIVENDLEFDEKMDPLQCLLCDVVSATRREMHDHYLVAHRAEEDNVSVCDRCGEFRLARDHICPSQLSFRCHMCRGPFKAGRDYWNHLIRASKKHTSSCSPSPRWWCGWARCAERFPSEAELLAHARLHLPARVQLMCGVCLLVLRTTDAKVAHMERHDAGVYECGVCRHACDDKESLRLHWETHAGERPHRCDFCGWRFVTATALEVHVRKFHEGGPFSCAKCPQKFDDRTDVRIHFGAAHGKMRCARPGCSYRCANKASLERHVVRAHQPDGEGGDGDDPEDSAPPSPPPPRAGAGPATITCPTCSEVFSLKREFRAHVRDAHDGVFPAVTCPDCGKPFKSSRDLDEHRRLHTGEKPFICAECGMTFKRAQNLEYHTKGAHKNERNFVCPECNKRFISNADMKRHLRYNHQDGKKWHLCPECGHKLPSLYRLKMHVQSKHTGERPHKCHLCDMGFVAVSDLKKHVTFKHNKEHPFGCDDCDKRYQRRRDLDVHRQRHHGGGQHSCATCGKDFDTHASMMQHSRYHTTEEAFQCAKCGRRFPHRMNLSRHLCTPDIKKNYHCRSCGLSFTTSGSLKSHRRRLHAAEEPPAPARPATKKGEKRQEAVPPSTPPPLEQVMLPPPPPASPTQQHYLQPEQPTTVVMQLVQLQPQHHQDHQQHQALQDKRQLETIALQPQGHHYQHQLEPQQHQLHEPIEHRQVVEPQPSAARQHHQLHHHEEHADQNAAGQDYYTKADKIWGWGTGPTAATVPTLVGQETMLTLTGCATYHDLEGATPQPQTGPTMHLLPAPAAPQLHQAVLRYPAPSPPATTLVVKSAPPPLVSLHLKADTHHPHMVYASPGAPAPTVKLVSVSQPPPLTSISSSASSSNLGPGGLILGAPIQTTADGSFHLVFVPHGASAPAAQGSSK